jgi:hypothetical protein
MSRSAYIAVAAIAVTAIAVVFTFGAARWSSSANGTPSLSVSFSHYGTYPHWPDYADCAFLVVSNSGRVSLVSRGVSASSEHQLVRVRIHDEWVDAERPWLSPGAAHFKLRPGQFRLVPLIVMTNLDWSVGFRYRSTSEGPESDYREEWTPVIERKR